jgi:hypothetical protein
MGKKKFRANTMALYAAFLVTVGLPLMALGVDVSRVELMRVKLRSATTAACQAYANSLDPQVFIFEDRIEFSQKYPTANDVFNFAMGNSGTFGAVVERNSAADVVIDAKTGTTVEKVVIRCFGNGFIRAMIPFLGNYGVSETATVKTKFSTAKR